jgi:hypothetical protein
MKTTLEFTDEDKDVAVLAMNVVEYWSEVDDIRDRLRNHLKYGEEEELSLEDIYKDICEVQHKFNLP